MYKLIDGKVISASVKERVKDEVIALNQKGITVGLAVIIVGEDPASKVYVSNKKKACEALGIISREYALPENTTEQELLDLIRELNLKGINMHKTSLYNIEHNKRSVKDFELKAFSEIFNKKIEDFFE